MKNILCKCSKRTVSSLYSQKSLTKIFPLLDFTDLTNNIRSKGILKFKSSKESNSLFTIKKAKLF